MCHNLLEFDGFVRISNTALVIFYGCSHILIQNTSWEVYSHLVNRLPADFTVDIEIVDATPSDWVDIQVHTNDFATSFNGNKLKLTQISLVA